MLGQKKPVAYAIAINEENILGVIRSEGGPDFDVILALAWYTEHQEGWFVRDETSPLDCQFFVPEAFHEIYVFTHKDEELLIRHIEQI